MFSHIVVFWTKSEIPDAADKLVAGAEEYLRPIPGILTFHVGKMVPSHRPVVEQTYQVALNLIFSDKKAQDDYQDHLQHRAFIEKCSPLWQKVMIYDFQ